MVNVASDRMVWAQNYFETFFPLREPMITSDVDEDPDRYGACVETHPDLARQRLQRGKRPYDSLCIDGWVYFWVGGKRFFGGERIICLPFGERASIIAHGRSS